MGNNSADDTTGPQPEESPKERVDRELGELLDGDAVSSCPASRSSSAS